MDVTGTMILFVLGLAVMYAISFLRCKWCNERFGFVAVIFSHTTSYTCRKCGKNTIILDAKL